MYGSMNNLTSQITAISLGMKTLSLINFILVQKTLFLDMDGEPQITVTGMNKFHKLSLHLLNKSGLNCCYGSNLHKQVAVIDNTKHNILQS